MPSHVEQAAFQKWIEVKGRNDPSIASIALLSSLAMTVFPIRCAGLLHTVPVASSKLQLRMLQGEADPQVQRKLRF